METTNTETMTNDEKENLQKDLKESLRKQGFVVSDEKKLVIPIKSKSETRRIQTIAKNEKLAEQKPFVLNNIKHIKKHLVNGNAINPTEIQLDIRLVLANTFDETLFRWWNLTWWSMPYQRPFGRQMRFIIWDKTHDAPFGLISLQSPILKQAVRDKNLGISNESLDYWVNRSMYAQRVGALPPYNELLGGKMAALSLVSNEVRNAYQDKYSGKTTIMAKRSIESELLFITTTSAFGRSSMYNRLNYYDEVVAEKLGYTEGYGSFQISDALYKRLLEYLEDIGENIKRGYGTGPSRKLKLVNLACRKLELANYSYHGIKREYYLFSFVKNLRQVISEQENPDMKDYAFSDLFDYWKVRWMDKRVVSNKTWRDFNGDNFVNEIVNLYKRGADNG